MSAAQESNEHDGDPVGLRVTEALDEDLFDEDLFDEVDEESASLQEGEEE